MIEHTYGTARRRVACRGSRRPLRSAAACGIAVCNRLAPAGAHRCAAPRLAVDRFPQKTLYALVMSLIACVVVYTLVQFVVVSAWAVNRRPALAS